MAQQFRCSFAHGSMDLCDALRNFDGVFGEYGCRISGAAAPLVVGEDGVIEDLEVAEIPVAMLRRTASWSERSEAIGWSGFSFAVIGPDVTMWLTFIQPTAEPLGAVLNLSLKTLLRQIQLDGGQTMAKWLLALKKCGGFEFAVGDIEMEYVYIEKEGSLAANRAGTLNDGSFGLIVGSADIDYPVDRFEILCRDRANIVVVGKEFMDVAKTLRV